jgi:uncharacterized membrane-anchored protein
MFIIVASEYMIVGCLSHIYIYIYIYEEKEERSQEDRNYWKLWEVIRLITIGWIAEIIGNHKGLLD